MLVRAFQERAPDVFRQPATSHVSRLIELRVARGRLDDLAPLASEIASCAGDDVDTFTLTFDSLAYCCDLATLVEMARIGWPGVRDSSGIVPWGKEEFVDWAYRYEMMLYCAQESSARPDDPALIKRLAFYGEPVDEDHVAVFLGSFAHRGA